MLAGVISQRALVTWHLCLSPAMSLGSLWPGGTALQRTVQPGTCFLPPVTAPGCALPWGPTESPAWTSLSSKDLVQWSEQLPAAHGPHHARGILGEVETQRRHLTELGWGGSGQGRLPGEGIL